ncbi:Presenilin-like protein [Armadillidium nasatum]|uniref:Presenilin n=1 Tax=Armadillidium nasatum TaxID=96803 RepID=A0A5N5TDB0_9CRUS|nr:Presenilin-like protein [Armadillidium nasatum]
MADLVINSRSHVEPNSNRAEPYVVGQEEGQDSSTNAERPRGTSENDGIPREEYEEEDEELELKYGAQHVIKLFIPVSLCMVVVVATVSSIAFYTETDVYLIYTPFPEESSRWQDRVKDAVYNALILLSVVIALTVVLIILYKQRCYLIIKVWLGLSSLLLLTFFTFLYLTEVLRRYNLGLDWISLALILWNFGVVGMVCIHWKGPLRLHQMYLIFIAALMSLIFIKYLPEYTLWVVLAVISIWDLVAVLCPKGPLRILVETAQERNEPIFPALIYSSNIMYSVLSDTDGDTRSPSNPEAQGVDISNSTQENLSNPQNTQNSTETPPVEGEPTNGPVAKPNQKSKPKKRRRETAEENGYVGEEGGFNRDWERESEERSRRRRQQVRNHMDTNPSHTVPGAANQEHNQSDIEEEEILVGKASSYGDWNTTFACFIAILIGLCLTLIMLAIFKKALPALPISIAFGLFFYFTTSFLVVPFTEELTIGQVYI